MNWYKTGTASFTNGITAVVGVGTAFIANVSPGEAIRAPDGRFYEIGSVSSDTGLVLAEPYLGNTVSGQTYTILPSQSYLRNIANLAAELVNSFGTVSANAGTGKFGDGTLAAPGVRFSADEDTGLYRSGPNEVTFVANGVAQFKYSSTAGITFLNAVTAAIAGGSIKGTPIGQENPAAGSFTTLSASGTQPLRITSGDALVRTRYIDPTQGFAFEANNLSETAYAPLSLVGSVVRINTGVGSNAAIFDASGNVGIGVTPKAWGAFKAIDLHSSQGASLASTAGTMQLIMNAYYDGSAYRYKGAGAATRYEQLGGGGGASQHTWYSAPVGTAGQPIMFTQDMSLSDGNLLVGVASGFCHSIQRNVASDTATPILVVNNETQAAAAFYSVGGGSLGNAANAAVKLNKDSVTGRSLGAPGTVNASGADYAEYERNNGLTIAKGSIVGFKPDGTLTLKFADAIRFGIKSTDPSYVGGDTWGCEDQFGKRPEKPCYVAPIYEGAPNPGEKPVEPVLTLPPAPSQQEGETDETFAIRWAQWQETCAASTAAHQAALAAYAEALAAWDAANAAWQADDASYQGKVIAMQSAHEYAMTRYEEALVDFEVRLEAARQEVDRVAYSGKVPVNVLGATPGGYIVASYDDDGMIVGAFKHKTDLSFDAYLRAVGRVNRILEDGRAEVAVMVH